MRKYDVLGALFENNVMATPTLVSKNTGISVANICNYLKELEGEGLVIKTKDRQYLANSTNPKLKLILDLHAIAGKKFSIIISDRFKYLLQKLCNNFRAGRKELSTTEINRIKQIGELRIVLKVSRRPAIYILKIDEPLVQKLLDYHELKPAFSITYFETELRKIVPKMKAPLTVPTSNDEEVVKMCDSFYSTGKDVEMLSKYKEFKPDERILSLFKEVELANKEYILFISSLKPEIRATIEDQWGLRYIYNTNRIEGNTMSEKEVTDFLKGIKIREDISKREQHETANTSDALLFLKKEKNEKIAQDFIKLLHFMVQKKIAEDAGSYKQLYNYIRPDFPTTPPQNVKERMKLLMEWYAQNEDKLHPFVLVSLFHMQFEVIHPFMDGNGRVGRFLINHILQKKGYAPVTIFERSKEVYYNALRNKSLEQFMVFILSSFIDEYKK